MGRGKRNGDKKEVFMCSEMGRKEVAKHVRKKVENILTQRLSCNIAKKKEGQRFIRKV